MQTIILYSKEKDRELLQELREALAAKGFEDDKEWNDNSISEGHFRDCIAVYGPELSNRVTLGRFAVCFNHDRAIIPVSRNDFQTMFLLY
jgi:hypothetical protein